MFDIVANDVLLVYEQLRRRYPLLLTTTAALDQGFTIDCPILVGHAHGQIIQLYEYDGLFVMDVMNAAQTMGTHWHPYDVESAIDAIKTFMEGKSNYVLSPFA